MDPIDSFLSDPTGTGATQAPVSTSDPINSFLKDPTGTASTSVQTPATPDPISSFLKDPTVGKTADAPGYFQQMAPDGTFLGISDHTDISGKPYFAYKPPGEATTTDTTGDNNAIPFVDKDTAAKGMIFNVGNSNAPSEAWIKGRSQMLTTEGEALKNMKVDTTNQSAVDAYNTRLNTYKTNVDDFNSRLKDYNTNQEQLSVISNAGINDTNATQVKYPFINAGETLPNYNGVGAAINNTVKWGVELPEEAVRTALQAVGKDLPQTSAYSTNQQNSPKDYFNSMNDSLTSQGVTPAKASWISMLYAASQTTLDILPGASTIDDGLKSLAKGVAVPEESLIAAYTRLGSPTTPEEILPNWRAAVKAVGGVDTPANTEMLTSLNNARTLLEKQGLPSTGLMRRAANFADYLTKPITDLGKTAETTIKPLLGLESESTPATEIAPLAAEAQKYSSAEEFVKAGGTNLNGIVPKWGTQNQYFADIPKDANGGIGAEGEKWELQQVADGKKPAFLNGSLNSGEIKKFAKENGLTYMEVDGREVVASNQDAAMKVIDAKNQRELGLALGYKDLGQTYTQSQLTDFYNKVKGETISPPPIDDFPDFPVSQDHSVTLSATFPGSDTVAKFVEKDVIPIGMQTYSGIKKIYNAGKDLFDPPIQKVQAKALISARIMEGEQAKNIAWNAAEGRHIWWEGVPEEARLDFMEAAQKGAMNPSEFPDKYSPAIRKKMSDLAKMYREHNNLRFEKDTANGIEMDYKNNYFKQIWENPEEVQEFFNSLKNRLGAPAFAKMREFELYSEGIKAGYKPVTTNWENLDMMREIDSIRIQTKKDIMDDLKSIGLNLEPRIKNAAGRMVKNPLTRGWVQMFDVAGNERMIHPEAYKMIDYGMLKPDMWQQKGVVGSLFRATMLVKGVTIPIKLLSIFHPILISIVRAADQVSTAVAGYIHNTTTLSDSLMEVVKGLSFTGQIKDVWKGKIAIDHYSNDPSTWTDAEKTEYGLYNDGGFSPKISQEMQIQNADAFRQAVREGNYIGAGIRIFPKLIETLYKPIFGIYIPSLRRASYLTIASQLMRADPSLATNDVARKVALNYARESIDNRFAQLNYKTTFWHPYIKGAMQAAILSPSMTFSPIMEAARTARDFGKITGKMNWGQDEEGEPIKATDVTHQMLFATILPLVIALYGGITTYLLTGNRPKTIEDYFHPRTGDINSDGTPARIIIPTYVNNYFSLKNNIDANGVLKGPVNELSQKENPFPQWVWDVYNNKDYLNTNVYDSTAPMATQYEQVLQSFYNENLAPISDVNMEKANTLKGEILPLVGLNPVPGYINRNPMQNQIFNTLQNLGGSVTTLAQKGVQTGKANIKSQYVNGKITLDQAVNQAVKDGYVKQTGVSIYKKDLDLPSDVEQFELIGKTDPSSQAHLISLMSESDLQRYAHYANTDFKKFVYLQNMSKAGYQFVQDLNSGKITIDKFSKGQVINQ